MRRHRPTVERIKRRVRFARARGMVYESIDDLLFDEELEERGVPLSARLERRRRRLAVIGTEDAVGAKIVSRLAEEEFCVIAFVRRVREALRVWRRISKALRAGKAANVRIVVDTLEDEDKVAMLLERVSQVIRIWEAKRAYYDARALGPAEDGVASSMVLANACNRSGVERLVLASHDSIAQQAGRAGRTVAALRFVRNWQPGSLAEDAARLSGISCVTVRLPRIYGQAGGKAKKAAGAVHADEAARQLCSVVIHGAKKIRAEGEKKDALLQRMGRTLGAGQAATPQELARRFLLQSVRRVRAGLAK